MAAHPHVNGQIRINRPDANGCVTLRRAGRLHHIGIGTEHKSNLERALTSELDIIDRNIR